MSKIIIGVSILFGIIIGFFASQLITKSFLAETIPEGYVRVTVDNKSGQKIKTLTLKHERGSLEMKNLANQESVNLIFKNGGENSYHIIANFDNDSIVSSKENYVEGGYRTTEIIFADRIKTENDKY
jgi:uncharacterized protein YneF (UPF0154 family)